MTLPGVAAGTLGTDWGDLPPNTAPRKPLIAELFLLCEQDRTQRKNVVRMFAACLPASLIKKHVVR